MRRSKFSRDEIKAILTEQQDGESVAEISARYGISRATFYNWKSKYQPKFAATRRLNLEALQTENNRLKKLLAEAELEKAKLKELLDIG